jgi:hypothetical protein
MAGTVWLSQLRSTDFFSQVIGATLAIPSSDHYVLKDLLGFRYGSNDGKSWFGDTEYLFG